MLVDRLDQAHKDIEVLQNPSYETLYAYIDRQIANNVTDTERKLALKADLRFVESCVPTRLEDLYRSINSKLNDLKVDIAQCASKEALNNLAHSKVS